MKQCPKCKSKNIKQYKYENVDCIECLDCGYDSCSDESIPEQKTSQREKAKYNPYKAGRK